MSTGEKVVVILIAVFSLLMVGLTLYVILEREYGWSIVQEGRGMCE